MGIIFLVVLGAAALYLATARAVDPRDLVVGDCLYIPTEAAKDPTATRPIGEPDAVEAVLFGDGAVRAGCTASHGHEMSAVVDLRSLADPSVDPQTRCEQAFEGYVGHAPSQSIYETFAALPNAGAEAAGANLAVCLVARIDGQWMDHPARGSGE